jgi:hypothetical protein
MLHADPPPHALYSGSDIINGGGGGGVEVLLLFFKISDRWAGGGRWGHHRIFFERNSFSGRMADSYGQWVHLNISCIFRGKWTGRKCVRYFAKFFYHHFSKKKIERK